MNAAGSIDQSKYTETVSTIYGWKKSRENFDSLMNVIAADKFNPIRIKCAFVSHN